MSAVDQGPFDVEHDERLGHSRGPASGPLGRRRRVRYRHFRNQGRRGHFALATPQPFTGFLPATLRFPMSGVSGLVRKDEFGCLEHGY